MTSDNIVDVSASRCVPLSEIENVLRKKSKWILNVLEKNRKKNTNLIKSCVLVNTKKWTSVSRPFFLYLE